MTFDSPTLLDQAIANAVQSVALSGGFAIYLRLNADGTVRCIAPEVSSAEIAKLLYQAADMYAAHAGNLLPEGQIRRVL